MILEKTLDASRQVNPMANVDTVGHRLNRTQKALVRQILQLYIPVPLANAEGNGQQPTLHRIRIDKYLRELVKKLYPVLMTGGIRLVGSCAGLIVNRKSFDIDKLSDVDVTILVSDEVDFNQIFHHQQQILRQMASIATQDHVRLLDSIRVSNERENWSLFSFGETEPKRRHLDIRVSSKMSRSFVFAHDSFEIVIDPLVVSGIQHEPLYAFSRFGDYFEALRALENQTLIMPDPQEVHHGLLRYAIAQVQGFKLQEGVDQGELEKILVSNFLDQTRSLNHINAMINKTARKHLTADQFEKFRHVVATILSVSLHELLVAN